MYMAVVPVLIFSLQTLVSSVRVDDAARVAEWNGLGNSLSVKGTSWDHAMDIRFAVSDDVVDSSNCTRVCTAQDATTTFLCVVAALVAQLAGSDECGKEARRFLCAAEPLSSKAASSPMARTHPSRRIINTLVAMSREFRDKAETNDDSALIALNTLWGLRFQKYSNQPWLSHREVLSKLVRDCQTVESFKTAQAQRTFAGATFSDSPLAVFGYYHSWFDRYPLADASTLKRRVLILSCSYGGGHKSAANAVSGYFEASGFVTSISDTTFDEPFIDLKNKVSAYLFNDVFIKGQHYSFHNHYSDIKRRVSGVLVKPCPSPQCDHKLKNNLRTVVLKERADLIITVYHMSLLPVLEVAKELGNLPVLHLATDADIKFRDIFPKEAIPVYPKFLAGVPFNLNESIETVDPVNVSRTFLSGYPVRGAFLKPFNKTFVDDVKSRFVPAGTKVMLIMTGGGGQDVRWPYLLADQGVGALLHIVVVAGGNNQLRDKLRGAMPSNRTFPDGRIVWYGKDENVTVEVAADPTNTNQNKPYYVKEGRLALLMDIADVVLSKPGGGSTAEIAYRGVPALFDNTITLFDWEQFTVDVFVRNSLGVAFQRSEDFRGSLLRAIDLGRSWTMVEDDSRNFVDPSKRIVAAAEKLLATECKGCSLWSDGGLTSAPATVAILVATVAILVLSCHVGIGLMTRVM